MHQPWEYCTLQLSNGAPYKAMADTCNTMGWEGWELISLQPVTGGWWLIFKRPRLLADA